MPMLTVSVLLLYLALPLGARALRAAAACSATCAPDYGGEDWPRVRWALQVWAHWPHLAELELVPGDILPAAQRSLTAQVLVCPLGTIALRLFLICSLDGKSQAQVLADNPDALTGDINYMLTCPVETVIASGWPVFSLLAMLRRALLALHPGSQAHNRSPSVRRSFSWTRRVLQTMDPRRFRGPPPLGSLFSFSNFSLAVHAPVRPALPFWRTRLPQIVLFAAKAAGARQHHWRRTYLASLGSLLREQLKKADGVAQLLRNPWPIFDGLSVLEAASLPPPDAVAEEPLAAATAKVAEASEVAAALAAELERKWSSSTSSLHSIAEPLVGLSGAVLPSEAAFLHGLADLAGADMLVESGVGAGGSTRAACLWARERPGRRVVSLERAALPGHVLSALAAACGPAGGAEGPGLLDLRPHADSFEVLGPVLAEAGRANRTVALFIDGPKGRVAVRLAERVFRAEPAVRVVALHDVQRLDGRYRDSRGRHLMRNAMERAPHPSLFSDEPWFVERFARALDAPVSWRDAVNETGSYGPTLGAFVRSGFLRKASR